nr:hypothetical protein [Tanacetum cinerariifolium]
MTKLRLASSNMDIAPGYDTNEISEVSKFDNYYVNEIYNLCAQEEHHYELHGSTQGTYVEQHYDSNIRAETQDVDLSGGDVKQHAVNNEETTAYIGYLIINFKVKLDRCVMVNRVAKVANERLIVELVQYKGRQTFFEYNEQKYNELEIGYRNFVYEEQRLT